MEHLKEPKILQWPQNGPALLKTSFKAYLHTLIKTLPLSGLIVLLFMLATTRALYVPAKYIDTANMASMFILIAILPILSMITVIIHSYLVLKPTTSYSTLLIYSAQRFLSIMGCIVSSSLLPLIIILIGIILYFGLLSLSSPSLILFLVPNFTYLLAALSLTPKLFSVTLALTENIDTNTAIETSETMVKGFFWRSFLYFFFTLMLITFIFNLPTMMSYYLPNDTHLPIWVALSLSAILMFIAIPWILSLWVTHQRDLYLRYQNQKQISQKGKPSNAERKQNENSDIHQGGLGF